MEKEDFIRLFLPSFVVSHFDVVSYEYNTEGIHINLDEKSIRPDCGIFSSKGFTPATILQDFPIRGQRVYLHVRRRKWLNIQTDEILTRQYDLSHTGSDLTHDFVAFLKATN